MSPIHLSISFLYIFDSFIIVVSCISYRYNKDVEIYRRYRVMSKQQNPYPLRIDETLSQKIKVLAKLNDRSYKGQIENILKQFVAEYEKREGEIQLPSEI